MEQANIVLDDLINKKEKILEVFCRKNGHSFSPINYKYNNFHSKNKTNNRQTTYKCKNCGITSTSCCINNRSSQKNVSFNEISLQLFNINFYELTKEITNINNYIKYLIYLKEKICEYFGHDVTKKMLILPFSPNLTIYECKCCGKAMNFDEYQNSQFKAICRGTTPESAVNLNHWHMFGSEASKISLPSFSS